MSFKKVLHHRVRVQFVAFVLAVCAISGVLIGGSVSAQKKTKMDTPTISTFGKTDTTITLQVCAGATGAPAGFSVQWITCDALAAGPDKTLGTADDNTWPASSSPDLCKASFSGNANGSNWNLAPGTCQTVVIGGLNDADPGVSTNCGTTPLNCNTCYVFRVFAHANSKLQRSDFTANYSDTTLACEPTNPQNGDFCTKSQGYYGQGNESRDQLVTWIGGDPTGQACTAPANQSLVSIGGVNIYAWKSTGTCQNIGKGMNVFYMDEGLIALRTALGGGGTSGQLPGTALNPTSMGTGGGLASQTAALTLNVLFNSGYDNLKLCSFDAGDTFKNAGTPIDGTTAAALNGKTIGQVIAAANTYLGGGALPYGLTAADLNELVAALNLAFHDPFGGRACGLMSTFAQDHLCY